MDKEKAFRYFDELTSILNQGKGVAKVVTGVATNTEVMVEYQPEVNTYP
jgi:hypothetical protein